MSEPTTGPLSWRDVYTAVGESEGRVVAAIEQLREDLGKVGDDHERRLRAIEALSMPLSERSLLIERLVIVERAMQGIIGRERGIFGTLSVTRTVILLAFGALGIVIAGADLVTRLLAP
jgi:hypothetical protein